MTGCTLIARRTARAHAAQPMRRLTTAFEAAGPSSASARRRFARRGWDRTVGSSSTWWTTSYQSAAVRASAACTCGDTNPSTAAAAAAGRTLGTPAQLASSNRRASSSTTSPTSSGGPHVHGPAGDHVDVEGAGRHDRHAVMPAQRRGEPRRVSDDLHAVTALGEIARDPVGDGRGVRQPAPSSGCGNRQPMTRGAAGSIGRRTAQRRGPMPGVSKVGTNRTCAPDARAAVSRAPGAATTRPQSPANRRRRSSRRDDDRRFDRRPSPRSKQGRGSPGPATPRPAMHRLVAGATPASSTSASALRRIRQECGQGMMRSRRELPPPSRLSTNPSTRAAGAARAPVSTTHPAVGSAGASVFQCSRTGVRTWSSSGTSGGGSGCGPAQRRTTSGRERGYVDPRADASPAAASARARSARRRAP